MHRSAALPKLMLPYLRLVPTRLWRRLRQVLFRTKVVERDVACITNGVATLVGESAGAEESKADSEAPASAAFFGMQSIGLPGSRANGGWSLSVLP